ncbi:glycosyltransferase family 4 protein [Listeria booriae]|uniref:glycosyltransferase family 4 protein n=1 Tax=Listeria booriae TaxID=1552123 RepID=UPI0028966762|nr:glycosyltransferase family 4 protein [Listeria booriae]
MNINHNLHSTKIFMFSSVHVWSDTRIFFKEAQTLAANGFEVDFYAIAGQVAYEAGSIPNLQVTTFTKGGKWSRPKIWHELYKRALASDAQYYHFHDFELLPVAVRLKKKRPNARIIYDMHENFPAMIRTKDWIPSLLRQPLSTYLAKKERTYLPHCDHLIFAESLYKEHYTAIDIPKTDILNLPTWQPARNGDKNAKFTFIYVGDIIQDRGVFEMLALIHQLKQRGYETIHLKLIGPMQPHVEEEVMARIAEHNLENNIEWLGRIPYTEIWEHYESSHVGLCLLHPIPNYMHSLATKLFEYMAAGLPILATNIPDWQELLESTQTGLTANVLDIEDVVNRAEQLIADHELRNRFAKNGRQAFETTYNWTTEETKLIDLYKNLNKESRRYASDENINE